VCLRSYMTATMAHFRPVKQNIAHTSSTLRRILRVRQDPIYSLYSTEAIHKSWHPARAWRHTFVALLGQASCYSAIKSTLRLTCSQQHPLFGKSIMLTQWGYHLVVHRLKTDITLSYIETFRLKLAHFPIRATYCRM
jgi:hypothetical protein